MALPAALEKRLADALAAELAKVTRDERAAFDGPSRTSAAAGRTLYNVHVRLAGEVRASSPVDVVKMERLLGFIADEVKLASVILTEAERRTLVGAVAEVGGGIAKDAGKVVGDTVKSAGAIGSVLLKLIPFLPYLVVGLGLWSLRDTFRRFLK
jgi:hypothetical protein